MILAKIHNVYGSLTETEKRIADYILKSSEETAHMTAAELSKACGTVPSAVNRLCNSLDVPGFAKLKILLATEVAQNRGENQLAPFDEDDTPQMIFSKVFNSGMQTLNNTYRMLDFSKIESMARKLASAKRVFIFGVGTSSVIAMDAAYRFSQLDVQAYAYTDVLQMGVMAKNMRKGDVAFGISHSGMTKAVVDAMRCAKEAGAVTLCLTSFEKSLLYTESDYAVSVYADEKNYPVEAVSARVAHLSVIDAFMLTIASKNFDEYLKHIAKRNAALEAIRY